MAEIRGQAALNKRLSAITDTRALLHRLQIDTTAEAKRLVPRKTGNLGRSILPGSLTTRDALVVAHARYAAYVEHGTKPHIIRPRTAQALRFPARGTATTLGGRARAGGSYAFAKVVHHPGTKPQPFLLPGAKKAASGSALKDVIVSEWNKAA